VNSAAHTQPGARRSIGHNAAVLESRSTAQLTANGNVLNNHSIEVGSRLKIKPEWDGF
jgi:hypothetical protein